MAWHATTPDGKVGWDGALTGDPAAVARIREALAPARPPVGIWAPYFIADRDERFEHAVLGAIAEVYGRQVPLDGDHPFRAIPPIPDGAVS